MRPLRDITERLRQTSAGRVLINAGWASGSMPVNLVLGIVQTAFLARMLGPSGLGALFLFITVASLASTVLSFNSSETVMVYLTRAIVDDDTQSAVRVLRFAFGLDFFTSFLPALLVVVIALEFPGLIALDADYRVPQALFALTIIFQSVYWSSHAVLRVTERFSWVFYHSIAHSIIKTVAVTVLFLTDQGLSNVVILWVGLSLFNGGLLLLLALRALRQVELSMNRPMDAEPVPLEVWRFEWGTFGRQIVKSLNRHVDTLLIGYFATTTQVGYYRSGKQLTNQIQTPADGFVTSLFPEYSRLYFSHSYAELKSLVKRFSVIFLACGLVAMILGWLAAKPIVFAILGEEFLPTVDVIRILLVGAAIMLAMTPIYSLPAATGHSKPQLMAAGIATALQITASLRLIPRYGEIGAAWASVTYFVVWAVVLLPSISKILKVDSARIVEAAPGT